MTDLTAARTREAIVEHTRRLASDAVAAGPDTVVPTASEWTVADLVEHVGQTQHWAAEIIERRITDPTQLPTELAVRPDDPAEWPVWLAESAQRVADACSDDALDAPVFNAAADGRTGTQFWMTSMLNESVVHGADAANAAGRPVTIDADVAAALITNHFAMLTSPTWELARPESAQAIRGIGQTLQWQATDTPATWFIQRHPNGATWHLGAHQPATHQPTDQPATTHQAAEQQADVTVTGPAQSLLLTLTRRIPFTARDTANLTVEGDTTLAEHWLNQTAHVAG